MFWAISDLNFSGHPFASAFGGGDIFSSFFGGGGGLFGGGGRRKRKGESFLVPLE